MDWSLLIARILYIFMWIAFIVVIAVAISIICSYFIIDVTEYTITSEKIPSAFNGYKILQISDLHNTSYGKGNSKLLKKVEEINPDIVVMTGDMISTDSKHYSVFYSFSEKIAKNYPTYYIMGNHEMRLSWEQQIEIMRELNSLGVNVLNNKGVAISKDDEFIQIYGLHQPITTYKNALKDDIKTDFSLENMQQILPTADNSTFNILLSHSPFDFEIFAKWGADLVLSGHVHGGLIRLPFIGGVLSPERTLFPKYDAGEYSYENSKMIVSRGLGNGTIDLRIFNNPELCVIKLSSSH